MLKDLHNRLALKSRSGIGALCFSGIFKLHIGRHASVSQVGVVGDGQVVTTLGNITDRIQCRPELAVDGCVYVADRFGGHVVIAKDDIAMIVGCAGRAGVLIGDKAGELAGGIGFIGCQLNILPR